MKYAILTFVLAAFIFFIFTVFDRRDYEQSLAITGYSISVSFGDIDTTSSSVATISGETLFILKVDGSLDTTIFRG